MTSERSGQKQEFEKSITANEKVCECHPMGTRNI